MKQEETANLRWSDAMSVGVPTLDSDHRCLLRIISLLRGVEDGAETRTMIETVLDTLAAYARFHFAREERVTAAFAFPQAEVHQNEHRDFARFMDSLRTRYAGRAEPGLAHPVFEELADWMRHHILIQDMAFKPFIDNAERAEQIARAGAAACLINIGRRPAVVRVRRAPRPAAFSTVP
jgi:hemerythrin-like metal-binding protein